jgi:hypothetical protein
MVAEHEAVAGRPEPTETAFVDAISRNLRLGRFLLLIAAGAGAGIVTVGIVAATRRYDLVPPAVGLAACAIAPAFASAQPIGQAIAAGGGSGVTAKQFESQNLTAPDQVDRVQPTTNAPTWPTGPQPAATRHAPVQHATPAASPSDDGGLDTGIWIAIGGGALVAAGGLGLVGRKRLMLRKGQLA